MPKQVHLLSDETLRRTGYRLLCSIYAEYEWSGLRRDSDPDVLDGFLGESDNEMSELLESLAALAPGWADALDTLASTAKAFPHGVGVLREVTGEVPLSPREACNKVTHAQSLVWKFDVDRINPLYGRYYQSIGEDVPGTFKMPRIVLAGTRHWLAWESVVDFVPFVIAVANWDAAQWRFG